MIKLSWCDQCANFLKMEGFTPTCKAFPKGIPYDYDTGKDQKITICNNGIGYEPPENNK